MCSFLVLAIFGGIIFLAFISYVINDWSIFLSCMDILFCLECSFLFVIFFWAMFVYILHQTLNYFCKIVSWHDQIGVYFFFPDQVNEKYYLSRWGCNAASLMRLLYAIETIFMHHILAVFGQVCMICCLVIMLCLVMLRIGVLYQVEVCKGQILLGQSRILRLDYFLPPIWLIEAGMAYL